MIQSKKIDILLLCTGSKKNQFRLWPLWRKKGSCNLCGSEEEWIRGDTRGEIIRLVEEKGGQFLEYNGKRNDSKQMQQYESHSDAHHSHGLRSLRIEGWLCFS